MFSPSTWPGIESSDVPHKAEEVVQMIRWSPSAELANVHSAMDRLFEDLFGHQTQAGDGGQRTATPTYFLPLDGKEAGNGYEIHAPVAGVRPGAVDVTSTQGAVTIRAEQSEERR